MSENIAYKYHKARNRDGGNIPGVPLDDLTEEQFRAQPRWAQAQIKASDMYSPYEAEPEDNKEKKAPEKASDAPAKGKE